MDHGASSMNEKYEYIDVPKQRTQHPDGTETEWVSEESSTWLLGWGNIIGRKKDINIQVSTTGRERIKTTSGKWYRLWIPYKEKEIEIKYTPYEK